MHTGRQTRPISASGLTRRFTRTVALGLALAVVAGACTPVDGDIDAAKKPTAAITDSAPPIVPGTGGPAFIKTVTTTVGGKPWNPPAESEIASDSMGQSIRRGLALIRHLTDSLPDYAPGRINCTNCHLQDGRSRYGSPLIGSYVRYPKYIPRSGAVVTMADRINFCITRSLAGNRLPTDSREMTDMITYLAWLSKGLPLGANTPGSDGLPTLKAASTPNAKHGAALYVAKCQSCHQANGGGLATGGVSAAGAPNGVVTAIPPLWGGQSYSVGASMARVERAASFIAHNMPLGQAGSLSTQEAFDIAAYVNSQARPDLPAKENDWPAGGAPVDLPYTTRSGHTAVNPPPLLPRKVPARTIVPAPPRAGATP